MTKIYLPEELNSFSRETLVAVILSMQDQLAQLNTNMERLIEQIASANNHRYGRSSEKLDVIAGQLELELIFNEAEALTETLYVVEPAEEDVIQVMRLKKKGKREEDIKDLPVEVIPHTLPEEKLQEIFGAAGWKQLPDEVYKRVCVQPAVYTVEEHHVAVYAGKDNQTIVKADRLKELLRNSILTPSLAASILNAKYVNGLPLYRISQEFLRNDIHISRQVMANWVIQCATGIWGPFMITFITGCTASMCCRPMRLRSRYQRMGGRRTVRVTCGSTGQERDMGIPQSSCMNTRRPGK